MNTHANARLSLKGRELLIDRVENAGWSLIAAAEAAGISDRTARKWIARYRAEGAGGLLDRSSAPVVVANRTEERRVEVIAALRRLRMTGAEIAESLEMALSTVSGILTRIGMGKLGRLGLEPAQRYERARPGELIHIDVKKLGRIHNGAGHRITAATRALHRLAHRRRGRPPPDRRLGVRARLHRRRDPPGLRRGPRRREGDHRDRVPSPCRCALRLLRRHGRAADHRQRLGLPLNHPRDRLPRTRHPPPPHPPLPPPDQRQSRAVHPHHARRLGLRRDLPLTATNATPPSPAGSTSTIAADHTAPSATSHPSPASTS